MTSTSQAAARLRCRSALALMLATAIAVPASGAGRPFRPAVWETLVRLEPGRALELELSDGQRLAGRLLEADPTGATLVEFSGARLSAGKQKRLVRALRRSSNAPGGGTPLDPRSVRAGGYAVRRVSRDQVASLRIEDRSATTRSALKVAAIVLAALYLIAGVAHGIASGGD